MIPSFNNNFSEILIVNYYKMMFTIQNNSKNRFMALFSWYYILYRNHLLML